MSSSSSDCEHPRAPQQLSTGVTNVSQAPTVATPTTVEETPRISTSDSDAPPIITPAPNLQPTSAEENVIPPTSSHASSPIESSLAPAEKRASSESTNKLLDTGPTGSTLLGNTQDSRKASRGASTPGLAIAKKVVTITPEEDVSEEDSNDSTFRSDVLDPLISCDPTATTVTTEGGRQRRPAITKQNMVFVLRSMDPNMVRTATQCLEAYIKARKWTNTAAFAREYYACCQVHLTAVVIHRKISKSRITFLQMREYIENISYLFDQYAECGEITRLGGEIRQLILMVEYLASCLERCSGKGSTDWIEVARLFPMETARDISPGEDLSPLLNRIRILEKLSGREGGYHFHLGAGNLYRVTLAESVECAMRLSPLQDAPADGPKETMATMLTGPPPNGATSGGQSKDASVAQLGGTMDRVVCAVVFSPFIFTYYASFTTVDANVLLLELVDAVNLQLVLHFAKKFPEDLVRHLLTQLMMAVEHLHYRGFIHRDIKPSGLLLLPTGRIKLADLTLSKVCIGRFAPSRLKSYSRSTPYEFNDREMVGTIPYVSPEVLRMRPYGRASDWWSVGMTAYAISSGQLPFRAPKYKSVDGLRSYSKYPAIKWTSFNTSQKLLSLVKALLVRRPSQRLCSSSYLELRSYSFFAEVDWLAVTSGSTTYDCTSLIEHARTACDLSEKIPTLGTRISADKRKLPLFTYTSAGFGRVVQKLMKKRPVKQQDIVDPYEVIAPDIKYVYKFKDFRKTNARRSQQSKKTSRSASSSRSSGSDEDPAVPPPGGPTDRTSDLPTASNARTTSIMSFVKELRNGL